jgi:LemA protein
LLAVIENYPDLQATDAFVKLQTQIEGSERRIKIARNEFNAAVKSYNAEVRSFPTNIAAGLLGFKVKEGFAADAGAAQLMQVCSANGMQDLDHSALVRALELMAAHEVAKA